MIISNNLMKKAMEQLEKDRNIELSKKLMTLIDTACPDFVEVSNCIVIKDNKKQIKELNMEHICKVFGDKTGFEASNSHIHLSSVLQEFRIDSLVRLKFAFELLERWGRKLKLLFPTYSFHLILSYDGEECTLRFHKYREEEGSFLIIDDLEGYKREGIFIKEF